MTITEQRQQIKGEAFRKIRRLYHPKANVKYSRYTDEEGSYGEQRDGMVQSIMSNMYVELEKLRIKSREMKNNDRSI